MASATPSPAPTAAPTPGEKAQSRAQQRCIDTLNRGLALVARTQWLEQLRCAKAYAKAKEPSASACIAADSKQKLAKALGALARSAAKRCVEVPDFGPSSPEAIGALAIAGPRALAGDLLGDLDAGLALEAADRARSRCQLSVLRSIRSCHETRLFEFRRCKKLGLRDGTIASASSLAGCLSADAKGKVASACDHPGDEPDGIRRALAAACVDEGVDLAAAFAGCAATGAESVHACAAQRASCQACRALVAADGLPADCDLLDDGQTNGSCLP